MNGPIKATLIYNADAGVARRLRPPDLYKLFKQIQVQLNHRKTESESDIEAALPEDGQPVVVMGGDGTVRAVMRALLGRKNPLIVLPGGTANNIARSFGLMKKPIPELIPALADPIRRPIDIGRIRFPWGESAHFMEGVGFGLFADMMANYDPEQGKSITRSLQTAVVEISQEANYVTTLRIDEDEIEDEFRMVELLNTPAVGPRLSFAPEARMTDGKLAVVVAGPEVRPAAAIPALIAHRFEELEGIESYFGRRVAFEWTDFPIHVDDRIYPDEETRQRLEGETLDQRWVELDLIKDAITLWLPNLSEDNDH